MMNRKLTAAVVVMLVVLPLSVVIAGPGGEAQAEGAVAQALKLDKPEDLATVKGLSYPGFACPIMVELDAGMLSMLTPLLEQLLQAKAGMPEPLDNLGKLLEEMEPEAREVLRQVLLREVLANLKGVAVAIQAPRSGQVNVAKVSSFYLQRATAAGWKPCLGISQGEGQSIALFQLPTPIAEGGTPEAPRGLVLVVAGPQQVIAAGLLGQLDLGKLLPLIRMLGKR